MPNCCTTGNSAPYVPTLTKPWNKKRVQHLYRRVGFGATSQRIENALAMTPEALVDQIVDNAINLPLPPLPDWLGWDYDTYMTANTCHYNGQLTNHTRQYTSAGWLKNIADAENGLRHKMALFWHNHFVTEHTKYGGTHFLYRYYRTLLEHAVGNFKDFCRAIITNEAMLFYLDGQVNKVSNPDDIPNENFAREFYELFTLGPGNYTDDDTAGPINDISETARALSGWAVERYYLIPGHWVYAWWLPPLFSPENHDDGIKTVFGQSSPPNNGINDVDWIVDNLFEQKPNEIAEFICTKIYKWLVHYTEIDNGIIEAMKTIFLDPSTQFEIAPVVRLLLKSEHFFEDCFLGSRVKSPAEFFSSFFVESDTSLLEYPWDTPGPLLTQPQLGNDDCLPDTYCSPGISISVGDPISCPTVNVFENEFWIRHTYIDNCAWDCNQNGQYIFNPPNVGGWDEHYTWLSPSQMLYRWNKLEYQVGRISYNQTSEILAFMENLVGGSVDPAVIASITMHHFIVHPTDEQIAVATQVFIGTAQAVFEEGYWSWDYFDAHQQVKELLTYIVRLPEYQLC